MSYFNLFKQYGPNYQSNRVFTSLEQLGRIPFHIPHIDLRFVLLLLGESFKSSCSSCTRLIFVNSKLPILLHWPYEPAPSLALCCWELGSISEFSPSTWLTSDCLHFYPLSPSFCSTDSLLLQLVTHKTRQLYSLACRFWTDTSDFGDEGRMALESVRVVSMSAVTFNVALGSDFWDSRWSLNLHSNRPPRRHWLEQ